MAARSGLANCGVSGDLLDMYSVIREISLPDLGNGIFIYTSDIVVEGIRGEFPITVSGGLNGRITSFGRDDGGAPIAQLADNGKIYKLIGAGVYGQRCEVDDWGVELVAENVWDFLLGIRGELAREVGL